MSLFAVGVCIVLHRVASARGRSTRVLPLPSTVTIPSALARGMVTVLGSGSTRVRGPRQQRGIFASTSNASACENTELRVCRCYSVEYSSIPTAKSDNFVAKYINYRVVPLPKFLAGHPPHACVPKFTQTTFGISTNNIFVSSYDFSIYHLTKY